MPRYVYHCGECEQEFEVTHSMEEEIEKCILCEADAHLVERVPSFSFIISNKKERKLNNKPGHVVKEFIEDARQDLKEEIKRIKKMEFE